jgi:hypothetical protein
MFVGYACVSTMDQNMAYSLMHSARTVWGDIWPGSRLLDVPNFSLKPARQAIGSQ